MSVVAPRPARVGVRSPQASITRTRLVALMLGLLVATAVAALRTSGLLTGVASLVLVGGLTLAMPTSRLLARRILLTGAIVVGATPALWWWELPLGDVGRVTTVVAGVAGGLTAWVAWRGGAEVRGRLLHLAPEVRRVDLVPAAAALASAVVVWPWLRVRTDTEAMAALVRGWDNSAHVDMVSMIRATGLTIDRLGPAPGGDVWQFSQYPQGYHALVAALVEALGGPGPSASLDLADIVHAQAWLLIAAATMVAAGVAALPRARRRPLLAVPLAVLPVAALVVGPGGVSYAGGFPNFVLACALTACVPLLVATMPRVTSPVPLAALGALLVGVAQSWVLLLVVAGPAAAVVLWPWRRSRWRGGPARLVACGLVAIATLGGVLRAASVLSGLDAGSVLVIPGGITPPRLAHVAALVALSLAAVLWRPWGGPRTVGAAAVPLGGAIACAALAAWQLHDTGTLSYYFYKLLTGLELVTLAVLALGIAQRLPAPVRPVTVPERRRPRRVLAVVGVLGATLVASQVTGPTLAWRGAFSPDPAVMAACDVVVRAAESDQAVDASVLVLDPTAGLHPLNAQQWYMALTGRWTQEANAAASSGLLDEAGMPQSAATAVTAVLADPTAVAITDPQTYATLRASVETEVLGSRLVTWPSD